MYNKNKHFQKCARDTCRKRYRVKEYLKKEIEHAK